MCIIPVDGIHKQVSNHPCLLQSGEEGSFSSSCASHFPNDTWKMKDANMFMTTNLMLFERYLHIVRNRYD